MKPILVVMGTRPEAIKLWPVITELRARSYDVRIASTNQQPDLLPPILKELGLVPEYEPHLSDLRSFQSAALHVKLGTWISWLGQMIAIDEPQLVIVQGDTTTALAGALAAFYAQVPIAHVAAGLRTYDLTSPFPEEGNRQMIARIATLSFPPTKEALANLCDEHAARVPIQKIDGFGGFACVYGNTGIDALHSAMKLSSMKAAKSEPSDILVTFHRRESWAEARTVFRAIDELGKTRRVRWVLHPNATERFAEEEARFMQLVRPMGYSAFVDELLSTKLVITDSGGVVEEAVTIGVPTIMLRDVTERSEALDAGAELLGRDELHLLERTVDAQLARVRSPSGVFGDGKAAQRIADHVGDFLRQNNEPVRLTEEVFIVRHGLTSAAWLRAWRANELPDNTENNLIYGDALLLSR